MPTVFDMGEHPLANDHCKPEESRQGFYPLKLLMCQTCGLAQLSAVVDREQLYRRYSYLNSSSATMQRHYDRLFKDIISEEPKHARIVEIASNQGGCLAFAKARGFDVLGIDPARNLAAMANEAGIETIDEFFDIHSAKMAFAWKDSIPPGVILARHVFAHIDDWKGFFEAMEHLATVDSLIVLEFPYALDLLAKCSWTTLYHEHLSVISLKPLAHVLKSTKFHIHRIAKVGVHGGALVVMLRHNKSDKEPHLSVDEMISDESITLDHWKDFSGEANENIDKLREVVLELAHKDKVISIFGASAKATVMVRACRLTRKEVKFCTDNSPLKPGTFVPGTDIPIIHEDEMLGEHPNYALMSAWNYEQEILAKTTRWRGRGGQFIIPDKEIRIV